MAGTAVLGSPCTRLCGDGVVRSHLGYVGCGHQPPWRPLVPGMGKGWGEEGGQSRLIDGDFCFTGWERCTLAPGKGGELGAGVAREWYLQAPKVTTGEKRRWLIARPVQFSQEPSRNTCKQRSQPPAGGKPQGLHPGSALQRQADLKISTTV